MRALLLALCLLPVAAAAQDAEDLPPGYPPLIGTVTAKVDGVARGWETYDYSIGAFDASAFFTGEKADPEFRLLGYAPGQPQQMTGRLRLAGKGPTEAGALREAVVEVVDGDIDDPVRSSRDQGAEIVLDSVVRKNSGYGHATGHFAATICKMTNLSANYDAEDCKDISGTFETDFQYDMY